jgi:Chalcone isomerase-like
VTPSRRTMMKGNVLSSLALLLLCCNASLALKDKATGITFASTKGGLELFGVGVRKKGPIKVYSVAMYGTPELKSALRSVGRTASGANSNNKACLEALRLGAKAGRALFCLEMAFKVGAEKMAGAIGDSVAPRYGGSPQDVEDLKRIIVSGVLAEKGAATKGTTFAFDCDCDSGITVKVDGKERGSVNSPALASAFCDVYLDDKCVSPAMRESCLENCCSP